MQSRIARPFSWTSTRRGPVSRTTQKYRVPASSNSVIFFFRSPSSCPVSA
jgi:hypothetical protein